LKDKVKLTGLNDVNTGKARSLKKRLNIDAPVVRLKSLILRSDLVIEAASGAVARDVARKTVYFGKDVMLMSTGGLLLSPDLFRNAEKRGCKIYIPSGAICGLDGVKAAGVGKITQATLTTRKPPRGLEGAPYIVKKGIDLKSIKKDKLIFSGTAHQAVKAFPKNINVSAVLSLAGIGATRTHVKIIVTPRSKKNIHEIELKGTFGRITTRCENVPSKENPKTSMLAAHSAIATLKGIVGSVRIGT